MGHRLIDDSYARCCRVVLLQECSASQEWDFKGIEVAERNGAEAGSAGRPLLSFGAADDVKAHAEASGHGQAVAHAGVDDAGNGAETVGSFLDDLGYGRG